MQIGERSSAVLSELRRLEEEFNELKLDLVDIETSRHYNTIFKRFESSPWYIPNFINPGDPAKCIVGATNIASGFEDPYKNQYDPGKTVMELTKYFASAFEGEVEAEIIYGREVDINDLTQEILLPKDPTPKRIAREVGNIESSYPLYNLSVNGDPFIID